MSHAARPLDERTISDLRLALTEHRAARLSALIGVAGITLTRAAAGLPITIGNRELIRRGLEGYREQITKHAVPEPQS